MAPLPQNEDLKKVVRCDVPTTSAISQRQAASRSVRLSGSDRFRFRNRFYSKTLLLIALGNATLIPVWLFVALWVDGMTDLSPALRGNLAYSLIVGLASSVVLFGVFALRAIQLSRCATRLTARVTVTDWEGNVDTVDETILFQQGGSS